MREALETLYAMHIMAEIKRDQAALAQLKSDIKRLESDIRKYIGWGDH